MRKKNNKTTSHASRFCKGKGAAEQGFTLIETAIAMLIMTIVGLGVAAAFFYSASNTANAADREMAMSVAQQRLEQLRSVAFTDATLNATSASGVATTVTRTNKTYSITTIIVDANVINSQPSLKSITIKVVPQASSQAWTTSANSFFASVTLVTERSAQVVGPHRSL